MSTWMTEEVVWGQDQCIFIIVVTLFCLLFILFSLYLFPSSLREWKLCYRLGLQMLRSGNTAVQLPSSGLWQWSTWLSPSRGSVWFSSLLSKRCLPDKLDISPFHTWVVMANVLKRYGREIDTWMMWCPRSYILYGKKWTEDSDGLTKGVGAGQVWISKFILHCLPRETLTRTLSVQPT